MRTTAKKGGVFRSGLERFIVTLGVCLALFGSPQPAEAWLQTLNSKTGQPVRWPDESFPIQINVIADGSQEIPSQGQFEAALRGFDRWISVPNTCVCLEFDGFRPTSSLEVGDGVNSVVWFIEDWPFGPEALGITETLSIGEDLIEADMELNAQFYSWGVLADASCDTFEELIDVENVVTHEAGHFLGLDHSQVDESTMLDRASYGECLKRTLHEDDIEGYSAIYACDSDETICQRLMDTPNLPSPPQFQPPSNGSSNGSQEGNSCANANGTGHRLDILILLGGLALAQRRSRNRRLRH